MGKNRGRTKLSGKRVRNQRVITIIVSAIIMVSVVLIVFDSIKKSKKQRFHSFYDNKYSHLYPVKGVDISHHNGKIKWEFFKNEGVSFAYLKSTEGTTHKDNAYNKNYEMAKLSDIKVGTYHFYTFGLDGAMQAEHFIRNSRVATSDLIPAIDVEHSPVNIYSSDKKYIQKVVDELIKLENELHTYYGIRPVIYTNKDCYKLYIEDYFPENFIWMSDLHNKPDTNNLNWIIWQFSHTGTIAGINGDIDLNYFRHSFRKFNELLMP